MPMGVVQVQVQEQGPDMLVGTVAADQEFHMEGVWEVVAASPIPTSVGMEEVLRQAVSLHLRPSTVDTLARLLQRAIHRQHPHPMLPPSIPSLHVPLILHRASA